MNDNEITEQVKIVGEPWSESTYYDDAERWTYMFWDQNTVFRRLFDKMDLSSVLELACGYGRHAEQCVDQAGKLILMDIFQDNLDKSLSRLQDKPQVSSFKNDGHTFQPVPDGSLTAIYCYDAMVHFSPDIISSYIGDASRVLTSGGMALFHHSNYPAPLDKHYGQNPHARNHMTQELFLSYAQKHGMKVVESVVIDWSDAKDLDCVTLLQKL